MTLSGIVINNRHANPVAYHPEAKPINEILALLELVTLIAVVFTNSKQSQVIINLTKLMHDNPQLSFTDWKDFHTFIERQSASWLSNYFTQIVAPSHLQIGNGLSVPCPFGTSSNTQLNIVSLENTLNGILELSDYSDPFTRNEFPTSYFGNKDVVIRQVHRADLENSLPVLGGCVFKPELWTNPITHEREMFARQAGRMVRYAKWNQKQTYTTYHLAVPNEQGEIIPEKYRGEEPPQPRSYCYNVGPMLIDFSPIGTIQVVGYEECSEYHVTKTELITKSYTPVNPMDNPHAWQKGNYTIRKNPSYTMSFILPNNYSTGIPIVCICGRLFFLDEDVYMTPTSHGLQIRLTVSAELLERIIISNLQHYGQHIEDTTNVQTILDVVLKHLFNGEPIGPGTPTDMERLIYTDFQRAFIVLLKTNYNWSINHTLPKMDIKPDKLVFPPSSGGLLVNRQTKEIVDYVRGDYKHDSLVMYQLQCPLNNFKDVDPHRLAHPQMGYEYYRCVNENPWIRLSEFTHHLRTTDCFELIDFCFTE